MPEATIVTNPQNNDAQTQGTADPAAVEGGGVVSTNEDVIEEQSEIESDDEAEEEEEEEGSDGEEGLRTEFINLKDALMMGQQQISRIPHVSAQSLRAFLSQDLYPVLVELADYANWYIGDLHQRVANLEDNADQSDGEGLEPEFAEQLFNFIGMSLQIFGVLVQVKGADPKLIHMAQVLIAQAPGLLAKIQEITLVEVDDDDDDVDDADDDDMVDEPPEVIEPSKQRVVTAPVPAAEEVDSSDLAVKAVVEDAVPSSPTAEAVDSSDLAVKAAVEEPVASSAAAGEEKSDG